MQDKTLLTPKREYYATRYHTAPWIFEWPCKETCWYVWWPQQQRGSASGSPH